MNSLWTVSGFKRLAAGVLFCFSALAETAAAGVVPGLLGEYFNNMTLTGAPAMARIDSTVNFNWGTGSPGAGVNANQFSVRWTGQVRIPANGAYTFYTQSDDGVRLWVDCNGNGSFQPGELLVDNWTDHSSTENSGSCAGLSAGAWISLRMEYYENGGDAVAQLSWSGPGIAKQIIPAYDGTRGLGYDDTTQPTIDSVVVNCGLPDRVAVLFSEAVDPATATAIGNYSLNRGASVLGATLAPDGRTVVLQTSILSSTGNYQLTVNNVRDLAVPPNTIAPNTRVNFSNPGGGLRNGLSGAYYDQGGVSGAFFTGSTVSRVDPVVDFDWGSGSPAAGIGADNFSVRWTGYVLAPVSGVYTFRTQSDDGIRLWVGGVQVISNWTDHGPTYDTGTVTLTAGQYYAVTLEFYERGGGAVARLQWQKPGDAAFSTVPAGNLFHCDSTPPGIETIQTTCGVSNRINVVFTEPVDSVTASVAGNYTLNNGASVSSAVVTGDGRTVSLQTSVLSTALTYQLRVRNVLDTAVPPNEVSNPTTANFTLAAGTLLSGLSGAYYDQGGVSGAFFTGSTVSRVDPVVDFDWGSGSPAAGIGADNFSVRWTGYVLAPVSGVYTFRTQSDDGIRLWVGGVQVISNWTDHGPTYDTGTVTLTAGQYYAVTLEFYERGGGAVARLQWQKPGDAVFSTVPAGNLFHCGTPAVAPGGFNAFETATLPGSISGVIRTKVAAQAFDLAVVALNLARTGVETAFEGDVKIELLDASAGGAPDANGCNASWMPLPVFVPPTLTFTSADLGRKNITLTENNVWRDVRVRISYPASGAPSAIGCSTDNFAIRPAALGFAATDLDWQTAGTARSLTNAGFPGGAVHKAGQPFTLSVTGFNATSSIASNYNGSPAASLVGFTLPVLGACPTCVLTTGAFVGAGGTVVSNTATYSEVGVFQMQAYDDTFSGVDAGDGSSVAERTAYSTISTVGRFVPDHFSLTSGAVTSACTSGAPTFTYMNQSFQSVSATVQAQNATGSLTVNYDSLGFAPGSLASVAWQAENADNGTDLSARLSVPSPSPLWTGGVYSLNTAAARFRRATPDDPDGPFDNLQLGVRLIDPDGVSLNGMDMNAATAGACAPCNAKAIGAATSVRFGRLSLRNAHGSELRPLRMPVSAEYWNGIGFVTNAADSCTTVGAVSLNAPPSTCTLTPTVAGIGAALLNGSAALTLGAPNVRGCADLRITTPIWLRGRWDEASDPDGDATTTYDDNAAGRATFGTFRDRMIFRREVTR